jgi:hypothetical protein
LIQQTLQQAITLGMTHVQRGALDDMAIAAHASRRRLTGPRLEAVLVDCGYVTGCDLAVSEELQICLYGPWKENDYSPAKDHSQFSKDQFTLMVTMSATSAGPLNSGTSDRSAASNSSGVNDAGISRTITPPATNSSRRDGNRLIRRERAC